MQQEAEIRTTISDLMASAPITDIHTHTFDPATGPLLLWGIDEMLT